MVTLTLGYIGYFLVMLAMYVFSFGPYEGPNLASFDRYMPTYVLICLLLIFMIFINIYSDDKNKKNILPRLIVLTILLTLIQSPSSIHKCIPRIKKAEPTGFKAIADFINANTKSGSKIYIIAEDSPGDYQYYIKYYMDDKTTNLQYYNLPVEEIDDYEKYFNENVRGYMSRYDYLYLAKIDDKFKEKYNFLFNEEIKEGNIYKIEESNIKLIKESYY